MKAELRFDELEIGRNYLSHYPKGHKNIDDGDFTFVVNGIDEANRTATVTFFKRKGEQAVLHCSEDGAWTHHWKLVQNYPISVWALDLQII